MTRADDGVTRRADVGRVPRRRGAVNGFLVVLLGLWGATIPLFGPYLGLSYGTDAPWVFTWDRALLSFLPGLAVVLGGLGLMGSARRTGGAFWGWLAALGGAWFVVGPTVSTMWNDGQSAVGEPLADSAVGRAFTELVYYTGLGALIVFLAAVALGRFTAGTGSVVTELPEQDRGRHDDDARHRADDEPTRADAYDQGTYDQSAREHYPAERPAATTQETPHQAGDQPGERQRGMGGPGLTNRR